MTKLFKSILLTTMLAVLSSMAFSQGIVKGVVVDAGNKDKLIGTTVLVKGTTIGTSSDAFGNFSLNVPAGKKIIVVQFIGYSNKEVNVTVKDGETVDLGAIALDPEQIGIEEVKVFASVAIARKTPVALSKIEPIQIEEKLSTQEFPEVLKSTPGVYATKGPGGFGDSRINLRGFESANVAVMINGVPMNDMEWGGVYWSNWAGLADVTRSMQVQRGLGASKVAAPSLGGSINIVTRSTDAKKGGNVSYGIGSDGYTKVGFAVSTGLTENNWAITLLGAKSSGNGYVQGTEFESYTYFVNISKRINDAHQLSFTAFGAPQWHNQRSNNGMKISEWQKQPLKYRYNPSYGFDMNGQRKVSAYNKYHKPQISLNHFWTINEKSSLSSALYVSIGNGFGYSGQGYADGNTQMRSFWNGVFEGGPSSTYTSPSYGNFNTRTLDGTFNYGGIYDLNQSTNSVIGSAMVMSKSVNSHRWYGLLSTYSTELTEDIDFYGGVDFRYYKGIHTNEIVDLYGGNYFIDQTPRPLKTDQSFLTQKLDVGDVVYRDYDGFVLNEGVFMQAEYNKDALAAFISLSGSNTTYWRYDRFYYDSEDAKSDKISFLGFSVKGGANYNITDKHNVFANIGTISRAPFFSGGGFLNSVNSNMTNPNAVNEKAFSTELGYGFTSTYFTANLNIYRTLWKDKTMVRSVDPNNPESGIVNLEGVNALHQGVELDFVAKPLKDLELSGMISIGDWNWQNDASGYAYNRSGQPVNSAGQVVEPLSANHARLFVNIGGIHVGNSAQTTAALGAKYEILKGFKLGIDGNYYGRNYSNFSISSVSSSLTAMKFYQPWQIPDAYVFDLNASYRFKIGEFDATFVGNVNNLFDAVYISDATNGSSNDWDTATVFYGFGRTYSASLKIKF